MSTKSTPDVYDCYDKIGLDEPFFVLRANDPLAADTVVYWHDRYAECGRQGYAGRLPRPSLGKLIEAATCADAMYLWQSTIPWSCPRCRERKPGPSVSCAPPTGCWSVECFVCGTSTGGYMSRAEAITAWNARC